MPSHAGRSLVGLRGSFLIGLKSFHIFPYLHRMCVLGRRATGALEGLAGFVLPTEDAAVQQLQCTM